MPLALLPASAQAFAPRSGPTIVLNTRVEVWLTQALKRINRVKRPLNNVAQHYRCLNETLSGPSAIWTLCSLMLPKAPDAELTKDPDPLVEAICNYQLIHVEAYVVHVDMVSQHEVAYKLTQDSIDSLVEYHKDIYSVDVAASTWSWSEKEAQLKKLHQDFVQAINRFVYRTDAKALEGLEDEGAGELLCGRADEVKTAIMGLFLPLLPPPPRVVDVVAPYSASQGYEQPGHWWHPPVASSTTPEAHPLEPLRVLGSSPSPTASAAESVSSWSSANYAEAQDAMVEPDYSQSFVTTESAFYSAPLTTAPLSPLTSFAFPSSITSQCGVSANAFSPFSGFGWNDTGFNSTAFPIQI